MNYLEMVNEVLVRMREEEVTDVNDPENDPEQRMVCKFVNDARSLVERSHAWNALRKLWVIDLRHEKYKYRLDGHAEASTIYLVRYANGLPLQEVPIKWIESKGKEMGSPSWFAPSHVSTHAVNCVCTQGPVINTQALAMYLNMPPLSLVLQHSLIRATSYMCMDMGRECDLFKIAIRF